ncbi:hypothetical protein C7448_109118 [Tenacibaculum gallaicum]|uniref:Uncharacterized protein n=1 Tax=Tenacibaculum gallaicum TaxID=561505 RepID=A0A3E0HII5_9FLAO|nr:hypothetical protein C7448_109118 [Tenacibaculum gallaicum]
MNDLHVSTIITIILICHLAAITIGYKKQKTTLIISYLNTVTVIGIFVFWAITSPNIKQHNFEFRELLVICLETCILIFAFYSIIGFHNKAFVKVINFIGFGIHLLATIGMFYYMFAFKFDKLF